MPRYDRICQNDECQKIVADTVEKVDERDPIPCPRCGGQMLRGYAENRSAGVIGDDIPGGIEIRHGLCHEDGTPRKYYSKTELAREAARRGWVNYVRHVPANKSTDKSPHTTRWV